MSRISINLDYLNDTYANMRMESTASFDFAWDGDLLSVPVPSDILDSERFLYVQNFVVSNSHSAAKQAVFEKRFPGISWKYTANPFQVQSFTSFSSGFSGFSEPFESFSSRLSDTSYPSSKKNTYSQHAPSSRGAQVRNGGGSHTAEKNIRPPRSSTSISSLPLFRQSAVVPQHSSSTKPTTFSTKNTGGWMGSVSTK